MTDRELAALLIAHGWVLADVAFPTEVEDLAWRPGRPKGPCACGSRTWVLDTDGDWHCVTCDPPPLPEALRELDGAPCRTCGSCRRWEGMDGSWHCAGCEPVPKDPVVSFLVIPLEPVAGCPFCHGTVFWAEPGGAPRCARCHPDPYAGTPGARASVPVPVPERYLATDPCWLCRRPIGTGNIGLLCPACGRARIDRAQDGFRIGPATPSALRPRRPRRRTAR